MRSFVILAVLLSIAFSYVLRPRKGKPIDHNSYDISSSSHSRRMMLREEIILSAFNGDISLEEREQRVVQLLKKMFPEINEYQNEYIPMIAKTIVYPAKPFVEILGYVSETYPEVVDSLNVAIENEMKTISSMIDDLEKKSALLTNRV